MKTFRPKSGPFTEQPFYALAEIEAMCADELRKVHLYPPAPTPIRIDRFIEKRFKIQPEYDDLPESLLGYTEFGNQGVEAIVVSKALDDEGTKPAERRLRTTLAHEGGHGLLHAHLFVLGSRPDRLFVDGLDSEAKKILCREGGVTGTVDGVKKKLPYRWWEFQANQAMGALLLPRQLVEDAISGIVAAGGTFGCRTLPEGRREEAVRLLAETFDVNPIVARIRLEALYPHGADRQLTL